MTPTPPLLAAWFVNPALLGGLGLVAVPIIIHLLSRRQFRRIEWGATRFLLEAERENRRRVRLEQWLLVALRCLAMGLLALLVARPFVQPGLIASLVGGRGQVQRVILIDDSASLAYRAGTAQDFGLVREAAGRLLGWLHRATGDPISVYLTSQPDEPLVAAQRLTATGLDDLLARVRQLKPTNLSARPRRVLETIAKELTLAGKGVPADLYVLSDFQRSDWLTLDAPGAAAFEPISRLDAGTVRVVLIAAGSIDRDNVAVTGAELERPQTIAGLPAVLHAKVVNFGRKPLTNARVRVEVDGAPLPPMTVDRLEPGQTHDVSTEVTFLDEGYTELAVGVEAFDGFAADNTRQFVIGVKDALRVLLVNGQPATDPVRDEVYFPRNALMPAGPFSSGIRVQTIDPSEIEATVLDAFDCVLLCNVAAPDQAAVWALERYARRGGGLVFFLGDEVGDADEYNRVFYADGDGLLPVPLRQLRRHDPDEAVGLVRAAEHPVTAMFTAGGESLSEYVRFRAYYGSEVPQAAPAIAESEPEAEATGREPPDDAAANAARPPATVLARFTDRAQTPALIERPYGRGRVLLFTSSVDLDWNDWARAMDGSYVVTLLELVQYAAQRRGDRLSFVAGDTLTLTLLPEKYEPSVTFKSPAFPDEPAIEGHLREPVAAIGEPVGLEGPRATRLGMYYGELRRRDGGVELRPLAVNLEMKESDLAVAEAHVLDAVLGNVPHEYVRAGEAFLQDDAGARRELWPAVLLALVVALMLEQALAWWFGTPDRGAWLRRTIASLRARLPVRVR